MPSHGELTTEGLLRNTIKVLGFPAIFRSDELITLTLAILALNAKSATAGADIVLVGKGWRRLCVTL